jgi:flagellum-specific ATP synthase
MELKARTAMTHTAKSDWADAMQQWLAHSTARIAQADTRAWRGRVVRVSGLVIEATGVDASVGTACLLEQSENQFVEAEVVGFGDGCAFLMPMGDVAGIRPGAAVVPQSLEWSVPQLGKPLAHFRPEELQIRHLPVGDGLLGRVLDANGRALDGLGTLNFSKKSPLTAPPLNPIRRKPVRETIDVGVRAINALLTVGKGQRLGLFAGSGVGKSVLLGMMAKYSTADRIVVGLIGERGREVKEFIEDILGEEGLARSVVIAAPADTSPLLRMQGAAYATTLAEHFRSEGHDVLLIMDSLTRYAMAQREIALSVGEAPATKGYPPSVFAKLPALVERAGNAGEGEGSITAFYTVLSEGDDQQDPIADCARAILDGHFVLSRKLAESGHYPAIDIEQSISRVMHGIVDAQHFERAKRLKAAFSRYLRNQDLISIGAYVKGADPELDLAIERFPDIRAFLQQNIEDRAEFADSLKGLATLFPLSERAA